MIVSLRGRVAANGQDHVVLDVNGIGYQVFTPDPQLAPLHSELMLHTVQVVRDDGISLYGFRQGAGCDLFRSLMKTSGVGPRLALAILSIMSPESLRQAVQSERFDLISRVPGVGRKTAEKIVLELRDKLGEDLSIMPAPSSESDVEVMDALTALGYSVVEAQAALHSLPEDAPNEVGERLRLALRHFA